MPRAEQLYFDWDMDSNLIAIANTTTDPESKERMNLLNDVDVTSHSGQLSIICSHVLMVYKENSSRANNSENSSRHDNITEILGNTMLSRDFKELKIFLYFAGGCRCTSFGDVCI